VALIRIQGGCAIVDHDITGKPIWEYRYTDSAGFHSVHFDALGAIPKIGDQIDLDTSKLIPLVGYLINNDPGFQKKKIHDNTWPEDYKG